MSTPTPTQDEIDRAAVGEHVTPKEYDGSGLDTGARPPGTPPPDLPDRPEVEPPKAEAKPAPEIERTIPRRAPEPPQAETVDD